MKIATQLAVLVLILSFSSCKETKEVINTASNVNLDGSYAVTSIEGEQNVLKSQTITFNALNKIISGNAGCNEYSGSYSVDVFALNVGVLTATEMYCDEPIMTKERTFMKALYNTGSYGIKDGILTLYSKIDRSPLLTAKRAN